MHCGTVLEQEKGLFQTIPTKLEAQSCPKRPGNFSTAIFPLPGIVGLLPVPENLPCYLVCHIFFFFLQLSLFSQVGNVVLTFPQPRRPSRRQIVKCDLSLHREFPAVVFFFKQHFI